MQEYYCNFCAVGHNDLQTLIFLWILPNGYVSQVFADPERIIVLVYRLWLIVPAYIISVFGSELSSSLQFTAKAKKTLKKA